MRKLLTEEQEDFFTKNQNGLFRDEVAALMNDTFGLNLTVMQIKELRRRLKPAVKKYGCRGENSGRFKKGHAPMNYDPVGTEKVKCDGYLWVKIADPNKWKQKHILLWEAAHGPRKPGEKILFLNGDRMDIRLENLAKVSDQVNQYLTTLKLRKKDAELTKAGINIANLYAVCKNRKDKIKKKRRMEKRGR